MPAYVSALREEVRNEHRAWPFHLDCRRDIAAIELSGVVYRVRPMRWREKCNLARYSKVGEVFLQRQLIKVCLAEDLPLPEAQDEFDALLALTGWVNAPGEPETELPLNAPVLAGAAMSVARQLGVRPSQLAHEKAEFVEQLWTLARASIDAAPVPARRPDRLDTAAAPSLRPVRLTPALPDPGDMNRIRILPDPEPGAMRENGDGKGEVARAARVGERVGDRERVDNAPTPTAETVYAPSPQSAPQQPVRRSPRNDASNNAGRQTARFRVRLANERNATAPSATQQSLPPLPREISELKEGSPRRESASRSTGFSGSPASDATLLADWRDQAASIRAGIQGLSEPAAATPKRDSTWLHEGAASAAEPVTDDTKEPEIADRDELFEEFADRLERAAEQMGIDL